MTLKKSNKIVALATLGAIAVTSFGAMTPAHAGSSGRKNTMYGAAAVTAYGLLTHRRALAAAGAVGTGVAYHNYRAAKQRENRQAAYQAHLRRQRYNASHSRTRRHRRRHS